MTRENRAPARLGDVSFWYADIGLPARRPPLSGDVSVDVCIIGAGYTGLWTAYYLKQAAPDLNVLVVEKEFAGFGASGRNGGWLSGGFAWNHARYAAHSGPDPVKDMVRAMNATVDEVTRVAEVEGIDADIRRTDELMVATTPAQMVRAKSEVAHRHSWAETRVHMIDAPALADRIRIPNALGAMVVQGVARVQPAKLVRGLADAVERLGVTIAEETTVLAHAPGVVETNRGTIKARHILRCTEGFTATLPGLKRDWLPMNSAQIVTDPLPADIWQQIGWQNEEILGDFANAYCYCQRTREGRIAVGARGTPYKFGSNIDADGRPDPATIARLTDILNRHFPAARGVGIAHGWCGVLGVPRDWCATVGHDPANGMGWAGGYVGVGVSTSNLSGRTLADLVLGRDTALTHLPWVNHRVRKWELEPLRWLGVHGLYALLVAADRHEAVTGGPPSRIARLANRVMGR